MTTTDTDRPIACLLDERAFAVRSAAIQADLFAAVDQTEELSDGYAYRFPGDDRWFELLVDFIAAERHCCPFFTFELRITPEHGPIWLQIRGSSAIKAFLRDQLRPVIAHPNTDPSTSEES